jgi:hypothetical protein
MDPDLRWDDVLKPRAGHGTSLLLYAEEKTVHNILSKINRLQEVLSQNRLPRSQPIWPPGDGTLAPYFGLKQLLKRAHGGVEYPAR